MLTCNRAPAGVGVDVLDWPVELWPSRAGAVGGDGDPKRGPDEVAALRTSW